MTRNSTLIPLLQSKLWIGAGAVSNKSLEGVQHALKNEDIDGIIFGSITKKEREGNPGTTFYNGGGYTLNSIGLHNLGFEKYRAGELRRIVDFVHAQGKAIIVSIAGDTPEEYSEGALIALRAGADGIELNLGCPNKFSDDGKQMEIAAYNAELMENIIDTVLFNGIGGMCLGLKLSPYQPGELARTAAAVNRMYLHTRRVTVSGISYVATSNTFPNAYMEDGEGNSFISKHAGNPNGYAGMAGRAMLPVALGQVIQFRKHLVEDIAIMGAGGIYTGADMQAYLQSGADAVQVVSAYYGSEDPYVFSRILAEYMELAT